MSKMQAPFCTNRYCHGGIGPHMTDECPWIQFGGMKLTAAAFITGEQMKQKKRIIAARLELKEALQKCTHTAIKKNESAECVICGKDFGWWCSESPDNVCHYRSYEEPYDDEPHPSYVSLVTGVEHALPDDYNAEHETMDSCIFCGQPEERK